MWLLIDNMFRQQSEQMKEPFTTFPFLLQLCSFVDRKKRRKAAKKTSKWQVPVFHGRRCSFLFLLPPIANLFDYLWTYSLVVDHLPYPTHVLRRGLFKALSQAGGFCGRNVGGAVSPKMTRQLGVIQMIRDDKRTSKIPLRRWCSKAHKRTEHHKPKKMAVLL